MTRAQTPVRATRRASIRHSSACPRAHKRPASQHDFSNSLFRVIILTTPWLRAAIPYAASSALLTSTNMLVLATCVLPFQATPQCFPQVLIRIYPVLGTLLLPCSVGLRPYLSRPFNDDDTACESACVSVYSSPSTVPTSLHLQPQWHWNAIKIASKTDLAVADSLLHQSNGVTHTVYHLLLFLVLQNTHTHTHTDIDTHQQQMELGD